MQRNRDLAAGASTPIALAIMAEQERHGYAIVQRVRETAGGGLDWPDGMFYPLLHRLERQGRVESRWDIAESGRRRRYYRIRTGVD